MNTTQLFYFSLFFCSALVTSGLACSSSNGEEHDIEDWEVCFAFWEELVAMNATNTNDTWVEFAAASGSGSGSGDVSDDQGEERDDDNKIITPLDALARIIVPFAYYSTCIFVVPKIQNKLFPSLYFI